MNPSATRAATSVEDQATRQEPLDMPVWAALASVNRALAEGGPRAKRYLPDVAPFGAILDRSDASWAALAELISRNGRIVLVTTDALLPPHGLAVEMQKPIVQMVLEAEQLKIPPGSDYVDLRHPDVMEMMDLAARTKPGPFGLRTIELGRYIGFRFDGVLAAMAGERMRFDRFLEISAVCVDPAYRGKGYAACLMMQLAHTIRKQDLIPFLHVFEDNEGAIALYKRLGFVVRKRLFVTSLGNA